MELHTRQAAALLLVLLTSYVAVATSSDAEGLTVWWVASGIGACVMVSSPRRHVPVIFVAVAALTWVGHELAGRDPVSGPWLSVGNAVEAYVIARLLTHNWSRAPILRSWPDLRRYVVDVGLGSLTPALMAVVLSLGLVDRSLLAVAAWVFLNHLACNLVLLLLVTTRPPTPRLLRAEVVAHGALMVAAMFVTYAPHSTQTGVFLLMLVAVWAGSRFPTRWAVAEIIALGAFVTVFAQLGIGPFDLLSGEGTLVAVLGGMHSFMATSVLTALVLATALALERERGLAMVAHQHEVDAASSAALVREREANVRMQSMDRAKNEMITTISHELRTPLTSIVGYVELLEDGADLPEQHRAELLGRISRNADRLLALAKDVLRMAAVDEPEWLPDKRLIDLRQCVLAANDAAVIPAARHDDLQVTVEVPDEPVLVEADPQEIERVVFNFVSNAIKFSPDPGTVRVWLVTFGQMARISVEDNGLGIARIDQKRIFERFYRTSIARQNAVPGTGLGLSIARAIAEAHGGAVGFLSQEGDGSTFWIDLPLATLAAQQ